MRSSKIKRKTKETDVELSLNIDGSGINKIDTSIGFINHMLDLFCYHGRFDINLKARGDLEVDYHHTVEDIGICLGLAFNQALADKAGIYRFASLELAMDEALVRCVVDLSGRAGLFYDLNFNSAKIGSFDTELFKEFFVAFVNNAKITLHIDQLKGTNNHHIIEACFKCLARTLQYACEIDPKQKFESPSTKGSL